MCHEARTFLPCTLEAVPAARHWLIGQLGQMYQRLDVATDDAAVVATEMVTNCVQAGAHEFRIAIEAHCDALTVATTDDAPGLPVPRPAGPSDVGGRGLVIIAALSDHWGVRSGPGAHDKTVWADLPVPEGAELRFDCRRTT